MGGKNTSSSSTISIPPEVMARYNSVNATAENAAKTPFQQYSTDPNAFVAGLTGTQRAGINNTNAAAGQAQPYFGAATNALNAAQQGATPFIGQSGNTLSGAYGQAQGLNSQAVGQYYNAANSAQPWLTASGQGYQGAQQTGSAYNQAATQAVQGGLAAATPFTMAGAQAVDPGALNTNQYMSPYMGNVVSSLLNAQGMQNAQQQSGLKGDAIKAGAFGGDRAGVAQANLGYQQNMANQQQLANVLQSGYTQAQNTAAQQQGQQLSASQANRAAMAGTGQQLYSQMTGTGQQLANIGQQAFGQGAAAAQGYGQVGQQTAGLYNQLAQGLGTTGQQAFSQGATTAQQQAALGQQLYAQGSNTAQQLAALGTGAQTAGLQGAQAQMAAGQVEQQTNQAGQSALYNQFLQQQAYPFQTAQFLANIAEGTGALSGSSTSGSTSAPFFSDERLKEDIQPIGKMFDGTNVIKFRYKGDPNTHIGLSAQEVERRHPQAVGLSGGFKTVDYDEATRAAEHRGHFADGGGAWPDLGLAPGSYTGPVNRAFANLPAAPAPVSGGMTPLTTGTPPIADYAKSTSDAFASIPSRPVNASLPTVSTLQAPPAGLLAAKVSRPADPVAAKAAEPAAAPTLPADTGGSWSGGEGGGGNGGGQRYAGGLVRASGGQAGGGGLYDYTETPIMQGWQTKLYSGAKPGYVPVGQGSPSRTLMKSDLPKGQDPGRDAKEGIGAANDLTKLYKSGKSIWDDDDKKKTVAATTPATTPGAPAPALTNPTAPPPSQPSAPGDGSSPSWWDQGVDWVKQKATDLGWQEGGRVGLAGGGYMDQPGIDDLTDGERLALLGAPTAPKADPGVLGTIMGMLPATGSSAKAHGGRAGLAGGGSPYSTDNDGGYMGQPGVTDDKQKAHALAVSTPPPAPSGGGAGSMIGTANNAVNLGKTGKDIYNSDWFGKNILGKTTPTPTADAPVAPGSAAPTTPVTSEPLAAPQSGLGGASPPMNATPLPTPPTPPVAEAGGLAPSTGAAATPASEAAGSAAASAAGDAAAAGATEGATAAATAAASEAAAAAAAETAAAGAIGASAAAEAAPVLLLALAKSGGYIRARRRRQYREGGAPTADDETDAQWLRDLSSVPVFDPNQEANRGLAPRQLPPQAVPSEPEPLPEARATPVTLTEDPAALSRRMVAPEVTEGTKAAQRPPAVFDDRPKPGLAPQAAAAAPAEPVRTAPTLAFDPLSGMGTTTEDVKPQGVLPESKAPPKFENPDNITADDLLKLDDGQLAEMWRNPGRWGNVSRTRLEAVMESRGFTPNYNDYFSLATNWAWPKNTAERPPPPDRPEDPPPSVQERTPVPPPPGLAPHEREGQRIAAETAAATPGLGGGQPDERRGPAGVPPTRAQMAEAAAAPTSPQTYPEKLIARLKADFAPKDPNVIPSPTNAGSPGRPVVPAAPAAPAVAATPGAPATTTAGAPSAPSAQRPGLGGNDNVADALNARSLEAARSGRSYTPVGAGFDYASNAPSIPAPGLGGGSPNTWGQPTAPGTTVDGQPAFMMANARTADGSAPVPQVDQRVGQMPPGGGLSPSGAGAPAPAPVAAPAPAGRPGGLAPAPAAAPAATAERGSEGDNKPGWISRNQDWLMPLLSGLGTMASSPSRYLGSAVLQGIGGAAASYENVQSQMQERAASQAKMRAQELATAKGTFDLTRGIGNTTWVINPRTGQMQPMRTEDYRRNPGAYTLANNQNPGVVPGAPAGATAPTAGSAVAGAPGGGDLPSIAPSPPAAASPGVAFGPRAIEAANQDRDELGSSQNPDAYQRQSDERIKIINSNADGANATRPTLVPLLTSLSAMPTDANIVQRLLNASGSGSEQRASLLRMINTYWGAIDPTGFQAAGGFGDADEKDDINRKVNLMNASALASHGDQRALGAIQTLRGAFANRSMNPAAAAEIAGSFAAINQQAIDKQRFASDYGQRNGQIYGNRFEPAAQAENSQQKYNAEANAIKTVLLNPALSKAWKMIQEGQVTPDEISAFFLKKTGVPHMGRYFSGG